MNYSYYRMSLDIHDPTSQLSFSCQKGDTSRCLVVTLTDHGKPYNIAEGNYAIFSARKPDGTVLLNDCTISKNEIFYNFTEQTASAVGCLYCDITLYNAHGEEITSPDFTLVVYETAYSVAKDVAKSTNEFVAVESIIKRGEEMIDRLGDAAPKLYRHSLCLGGCNYIGVDFEILKDIYSNDPTPLAFNIESQTDYTEDILPTIAKVLNGTNGTGVTGYYTGNDGYCCENVFTAKMHNSRADCIVFQTLYYEYEYENLQYSGASAILSFMDSIELTDTVTEVL